MTSAEDKSRDVDTAVEDLRRYKAHLSEVARYKSILDVVYTPNPVLTCCVFVLSQHKKSLKVYEDIFLITLTLFEDVYFYFRDTSVLSVLQVLQQCI